MQKKLIALLPVLGVALLAQYMHKPSQRQVTNSARPGPYIVVPFCAFNAALPKPAEITVLMGVRTIKSVSIKWNASSTDFSRAGQEIDFDVRPLSHYAPYGRLELMPHSLARLPVGMYIMRADASDGTSSTFNVLVYRPVPQSLTHVHKPGMVASIKPRVSSLRS
jgi:hypothetical protein